MSGDDEQMGFGFADLGWGEKVGVILAVLFSALIAVGLTVSLAWSIAWMIVNFPTS